MKKTNPILKSLAILVLLTAGLLSSMDSGLLNTENDSNSAMRLSSVSGEPAETISGSDKTFTVLRSAVKYVVSVL